MHQQKYLTPMITNKGTNKCRRMSNNPNYKKQTKSTLTLSWLDRTLPSESVTRFKNVKNQFAIFIIVASVLAPNSSNTYLPNPY